MYICVYKIGIGNTFVQLTAMNYSYSIYYDSPYCQIMATTAGTRDVLAVSPVPKVLWQFRA